MVLKVYCDNNIVSALSKRDLKADEMKALDQLVVLAEMGAVILDTSLHSYIEIERAPVQHQPALKKPLNQIGRVHQDREVKGFAPVADQYGGQSAMPLVGDIVAEKLYERLLGVGLEIDDAKHFMYGVHNGYDRFLTCDRDFLDRREDLAKLCPAIQIKKPSELLQEVRNQGESVSQPLFSSS